MKKITVRAPGRINLIGEHTDYNEGYVFPAAIDKYIEVSFETTDNAIASLSAENLNQTASFDLATTQIDTDKGWLHYIFGVVKELQKEGAAIHGFKADFKGNVPLGSGLSSSAALECAFAFGLNKLFDLGFDKKTLVKIAQRAEHNYVGTLCGIMDQYASIFGKKDHALVLDCQSESHEYFPIDLGQYELLVINTNVKHSLSDSEYNTRRKECEQGVSIVQQNYPEATSLRLISMAQLNEFKDQIPSKVYDRCRYVIAENNRVLQAAQALQDKDLESFGRLLYASHHGLQFFYEVSCIELDFLVNLTFDKDYILGARMMGGGFGGCTLHLIQKDKVNTYLDEVCPLYLNTFGKECSPYRISIENGVFII